MTNLYTNEKNTLILISLLKLSGINKVIASPGTTNMAFIRSIQNDSFFEIYSSVDERSAAYMACGLAHESNSPVVLSCTGATASRNYLPGITEAYYRKLPVLAVTSSQELSKVGHNIPQIIDRSLMPKDTYCLSLDLPIVKDDNDWWDCEIKINKAIMEVLDKNSGPVHVNLPTTYDKSFNITKLPTCRLIRRFKINEQWPQLKGKVCIFIGSHKEFNNEETKALEKFSIKYDAVVFCDHTSSYNGKNKLLFSLLASQDMHDINTYRPDITIHIGNISGDYSSEQIIGREVWRVNPDGRIIDTFNKLKYVFAVDEEQFFLKFNNEIAKHKPNNYFELCQKAINQIRNKIPEVPFSNIWIAKKIAHRIPENSIIHFGILNSLRSWNFFELPKSVKSFSNVGGFGIDGALSTILGASLYDSKKIYFAILGDLAFFYDLNALGNRQLKSNLRIMLINNGTGTEFKQYNHFASDFGDDNIGKFISASGHFANKSPELVKNFAENLGFKYFNCSNKEEFENVINYFLDFNKTDKPMLLEVFTNSEDESTALEIIRNIKKDDKKILKKSIRNLLGEKGVKLIKNFIGHS